MTQTVGTIGSQDCVYCFFYLSLFNKERINSLHIGTHLITMKRCLARRKQKREDKFGRLRDEQTTADATPALDHVPADNRKA